MTIEQRMLERSDTLTRSERRIGETILSTPELVAFGTVAEVATAASVGTATVVRFAVKLGFDGYSELQAAARREVSGQLRPAVERIRDPHVDHDDVLIQRHADVETTNVGSTLAGLDAAAVGAVVDRLADTEHAVLVLSGVASRGVAQQFVGDLEQLRPDVRLLDGTPIDIVRTLALAGDDATLVVLDLRRYEQWLLDALHQAASLWTVAITDSVLSPLAASADRALVVAAASAGPFDSHVGTLALLNYLVIGVAVAQRGGATVRLDRLEAAWRSAGALTED
jgi:DNA-binding MurR/RpiR family transcriptional regulator